uniref:Uncharacterized protein n=1 Tax=Anguilla anguilla TaxID=7936 RepID=A0A0E9W758_ANGAN
MICDLLISVTCGDASHPHKPVSAAPVPPPGHRNAILTIYLLLFCSVLRPHVIQAELKHCCQHTGNLYKRLISTVERTNHTFIIIFN